MSTNVLQEDERKELGRTIKAAEASFMDHLTRCSEERAKLLHAQNIMDNDPSLYTQDDKDALQTVLDGITTATLTAVAVLNE